MSNHHVSRRNILAIAGSAALVPGVAAAQPAYPSRPVRFVVGFPAGGASDAASRILGAELSKSLRQQFVIENKAGASGNIATQAVVNAAPDGHTIYLAQINLATNPSIMEVGYDPAKDLAMVTQITSVPVIVLVNPKSGMKSLRDVVAAAKARDGQLKFGGVYGTSAHLGPELFARDQGFKFKLVPYRGGAQAVQALMAEEVDVVFDLMSGTLKSIIGAGTLRGVAVMQADRVKGLEAVPAAGTEGVGPGGFFRSWMGVCVRAGTPAPLIEKLHAATLAALANPEVREKLEQLGGEVVTSPTPADFQRFYLAEIDRFGELIKSIGYKPQ